MHSPVDTKDPEAVQAEVQRIFTEMYPGADPSLVRNLFAWARQSFDGQIEDYQAIDAVYHDLEHTFQGTLCLSRLLLGRQRANVEPRLDASDFQLGLAAILLHDSGYLKRREDLEGTGAKYTVTHVARSAEFAGRLLARKGLNQHEIRAVQNMICCTGVNAQLATIAFQNSRERVCGLALATADLLGQMAAEDYVEKLPVLFSEFEEASRFSKDSKHFVSSFHSASELRERTPLFWRQIVRPKLEVDFEGLYRFLSDPYPSGPNDYLDRIEANLRRIASTH